MKIRPVEKLTAILCALCLAVAVMSGSVFARDEELPEETTPAPEATFVVVDASSEELSLESDEVIDNRGEIPFFVGEDLLCTCPLTEGVPYMSGETFFRAVGLGDAVNGDGQSLTVSAEGLTLQCSVGENILVCNDRCLYAAQGILSADGEIYLPVELLVKCVGIGAAWDRSAWRITLYPEETSYLEGGDSFYDETDVYWLSRLIYATAGDNALTAKIGIGNVVIHRTEDPTYEGQDTVYDVIFAKNQFDEVINGMIYMTPDEEAVLAAKVALEGFDVTEGATDFTTDTPEAGQIVSAVIDGITFTTALEEQS